VNLDPLAPLPRTFYSHPTETVARDLLGRYLALRISNGLRIGRIVETEAYVGVHDLASHSSHGRTNRTAPMFEEPGKAYVYFIYGMYWCLNVVTEEEDSGCAVLLRAIEPISGIEGTTNGPGKLCRALGIDGAYNRADLTDGDLVITEGHAVDNDEVTQTPRIGVQYAGDWAAKPLRFLVASSQYTSRYVSPRKLRALENAQ
jgi:DNA-3-methyladenine glycosylase